MIFEGPTVMDNHVFFETRFFINKTLFFENRALAQVKTLLLKGRGRFGRSSEPTDIEKSEVWTPNKNTNTDKIDKLGNNRKTIKKRNLHQTIRIQAENNVCQQFIDRKNKKLEKLGGQKT